MYKFLIKQYEKAPFDSYLFSLALNHHVKINDFDTVKEMIEKTNWKTEKNLHAVKTCALFDCSFYKKPGYKLFDLLFSQIAYPDPAENFAIKITGEDVKKYDLYRVIDNCVSHNKIGFLNKLLKKYSYFNLIEHTLESCIKSYKNELCIKYYELNKSVTLQEKLITYSIKHKNISMLEYSSKNHNIFNRYSSWQAEKYPEKTNEHYYIDTTRFLDVMHLNNKITDKIIANNIQPKDFCSCLKELLTKNRNKLAIKWLDKLNKNELSFQLRDIDVLTNIKVNPQNLSLKSFCVYYNLTKAQKLLDPNLLLSDYRFMNSLNQKIIDAISHGKAGYLNFIKNEFKLEKILFNSVLMNSYYTEMSARSIKLEHELSPLTIEKKINLCLSNQENSYLVNILKKHSWSEIEKVMTENKVHSVNAQYILYHYMNTRLDEKPVTKKVKI